MMVNPYR